MKSAVNPFVDIILIFVSRSSSLVLVSVCLFLFEVIFYLSFLVYHRNKFFFYKISNLPAKFSDVNKFLRINILVTMIIFFSVSVMS